MDSLIQLTRENLIRKISKALKRKLSPPARFHINSPKFSQKRLSMFSTGTDNQVYMQGRCFLGTVQGVEVKILMATILYEHF